MQKCYHNEETVDMKPGMTMITLRMPVSTAEILRTRAKSLGLSINAYCMLTLVIDWIPAGAIPALPAASAAKQVE